VELRRITEEVLFPAAMAIDAAPIVPRRYLDLIAEAGLYDLPADPVEAGRVVEALGGASLVTAFVWIQHHSPVRAVLSRPPHLRDRYLAGMQAGRVRAGIAYAALRRPGPPSAVAEPVAGEGWRLTGHAPWVTGWGLVDVIQVGARAGDRMLWLLIDAAVAPGMKVRPVELAVLQASATVELRWEGMVVPADRVLGIEGFEEWRTRDAGGRQLNGYLPLGVAARCAQLLGREPLARRVEAARAALDRLSACAPGSGGRATSTAVSTARAGATLLAVRAAAALVAAGGGRSVEAGQHAARLMREAAFLLVFGQTSEIRAAQLDVLLGDTGHAPFDGVEG
jgi:alkylation response protein AidB-like acyl-CoA dehydrogenase